MNATKNTESTVRPLSTEELVALETKTADRHLAVRTNLRAGTDPTVWGKFAKYR